MLPGLAGICGPASAVGGGGGPTDPNFSSVKLLMGFEGSNGSTGAPGMTDESSAAHGNAAASSGASISTAQFKFGASSLFVDGASDITFAHSLDWEIGADKFTIEMFIRPHALPAFNQFLCAQWGHVGTNEGWVLYIATNKLAWLMSTTGTNSVGSIIGTTTLAIDSAWYHACIDYDGAKYRLYLNGALEGSFSTPTTIFTSPFPLALGSSSQSATIANYTGYYDEVRFTRGVARYASDSGFTVPTARFPRS
ncbi:LamG domain-containing protein [Bradyrhizobium sp. AZCC 2289]|uniref:LamG domain-containing protein n=1 Tax=Bradyrhizobium sp. AZCC 2289 TaxID=3117026 RepID=UPI002FF10893